MAYGEVADVEFAQGDLGGALESYSEGLKVIERMAETFPRNVEWQANLAVTRGQIGDVLTAQGKLTAALNSYRSALAIFDGLLRRMLVTPNGSLISASLTEKSGTSRGPRETLQERLNRIKRTEISICA